MPLEDQIHRLSETVHPSDGFRGTVKSRLMKRIGVEHVSALAKHTEPSQTFHASVRDVIMKSIRPTELLDLVKGTLPQRGPLSLRFSPAHTIQPTRTILSSVFKWSTAFVLTLVIIRSMPLILLAPPTNAETIVQLLPSGEGVNMYVGGVWQAVTGPVTLKGPVMITTGSARATLVLNDDGVIRLAPGTTLKLHDTSDYPHVTAGPTATLVRGQAWALGLLPPLVEGLLLETDQGILALNAGSASVFQDARRVSVAAYDKGVTFLRGTQPTFLVAGEKATFAGGTESLLTLPPSAYEDSWVSDNLSQDAVHRTEIAVLQEDRREKTAGILPTSILYSAKRIAEHVDVLFTLTEQGRQEKRVMQASTRLSEAIALLKNGEDEEAAAPLREYGDSLVALASDQEDNIVKDLLRQQIAEAGASLAASATAGSGSDLELLTMAVRSVDAAIPDADLKPEDIQGYVLVDRLTRINTLLSRNQGDAEGAVRSYAEIRPYLGSLLLSGSGAHPLLQKEARSLLVSTSSLLAEVDESDLTGAVRKDIEQYLPPKPDEVLVTEDELNQRIALMIERIFLFRHPRSRYNQLLAEMRSIEGDPNRGTLLRRLKSELPDGLGEYVNTEIKTLGEELQ